MDANWRVGPARLGTLRCPELLFFERPASREVALDVRRPWIHREGKHCLDEAPVLGWPLVWHASHHRNRHRPRLHGQRPTSLPASGNPRTAAGHKVGRRLAVMPPRRTAATLARVPSSNSIEVVLLSFGAIDPHSLQMLGTGVAAVAMIILGQAKGMLEERAHERCAACRRLIPTGRRCPQCG